MGFILYLSEGKDTQKETNKKESGNTIKHLMDSAAFKGLIMAVIALYVIAILVQAVVPGALTSASNTTALGGQTCGTNGNASCYSNVWSSSSQTAWSSIPAVMVVIVVVIFIAIVIAVINLL